jgi:hypothetical protein
MTIAVDTVCTHAQLQTEIGSAREIARLIPPELSASSATFREAALADVIKALSRRAPPVYEADLADVTDLRDAVAYGAAERLYRLSLTGAADTDAQAAKWRYYRDRFRDELDALAPSVGNGSTAAVGAIQVSRR